MSRTDGTALGGFLSTFAEFLDFRTHGPRKRIDNYSAPSGKFEARFSAPMDLDNRSPAIWPIVYAADTDFA